MLCVHESLQAHGHTCVRMCYLYMCSPEADVQQCVNLHCFPTVFTEGGGLHPTRAQHASGLPRLHVCLPGWELQVGCHDQLASEEALGM